MPIEHQLKSKYFKLLNFRVILGNNKLLTPHMTICRTKNILEQQPGLPVQICCNELTMTMFFNKRMILFLLIDKLKKYILKKIFTSHQKNTVNRNH